MVSISRGGTIVIVFVLQARQIAGAGLNVFLFEPTPFDNPLLQCDNVILTLRIGGVTGGARNRQMGDVLSNIYRYLKNGPIANRVI